MEFGHTVKLIAPQFVKPYVKTNKNDAADAEAICEAVGRPNMRFVPTKNTEQQALLGMHRARQGFVTERTAQANQIRGLLAEFGLVIPVGIRSIGRKLPEFLEDAENGLSGASRALFARLFEHFRALDRQVEELEREINAWHREDTASQRLQAILGIGPLTASALVASVGMQGSSIPADSLLRGSALYPARVLPAERRTCSASANAATRTYSRC